MDKERGRQAGTAEGSAGVERQRDGASARGFERVGLEPLVLASSSPRRAEILRNVGWPFEAQAADVDESTREGESPVAYVERLAREKAEAVAARRLFGLVLGADTTVVVEGRVLGKPRDDEEAREMLRLLSGRTHEVLTGVALVRAESKAVRVAHERTRVRFGPMTGEEINWHVAVGELLDKAGAYAVQSHAALFIEAIEGDYWNVVGLPVRLVYKLAWEMKQ
ncbi:MAG TPA: Maf family protein [Pyrinomonadaceae bacterium]|nr:Maf family protein [Pyrinomonadaceae bacterium]